MSWYSGWEWLDLSLEAGPEGAATELLDDTYSISIRRGLRSNGVTDDLEPATFSAVIKGVGSHDPDLFEPKDFDPRTNDDLRPGRPIRLRATDRYDGVSWTTVWAGEIQRARIEYDSTAKDDYRAYRLHIEGTDLVSAMAGRPSEVAVDGNLHQRVAAVMDPTGLPYVVDDPSDPGAGTPLPTDAKDVIGQLRLIRDTAHALVYVNRVGELVVTADATRPRTVTDPDWWVTDDAFYVEHIWHTDIDLAFDTDAVVNILTIKTIDGADDPEVTYTDEESRAAWGDKPQTVTVNDGLAESHAGLYLASRVTPDLIPRSATFVIQRRLPQASVMTGSYPHLEAALGMELYDTVRVVRLERDEVGDFVDTETDHLIQEIVHNITPQAWTVTLGLRVPEVLAARWDDVPADLTWDDVPADLTWDDAVNWHPYL